MADLNAARPASVPPSNGAGRKGTRFIDVRGIIRQASTRVSVDQLVRQGKKFISMLSRERIEELISQSVKNIVEKYRVQAVVSPEQLQAESKQEFGELLQQYQQTALAGNAVHATKSALDEDVEELRNELERRIAEDQDLADGYAEFELKLGGIVAKAFKERRQLLEEPVGPETEAELQRIEGILREIVQRLAAAERERFKRNGRAQGDVAVMQKRLEKLVAHIAALESALKTISTSKLFSNQQLQNLLRDLGLAQNDKYFEKKKEMLQFVLTANKDLRVKAGEMESRGITLASPVRQFVKSA